MTAICISLLIKRLNTLTIFIWQLDLLFNKKKRPQHLYINWLPLRSSTQFNKHNIKPIKRSICLFYKCVFFVWKLTCRALPRVSPGLAIAARMAVVVVPIFEPRDNGYALSMLMTPIPIEKRTRLSIYGNFKCKREKRGDRWMDGWMDVLTNKWSNGRSENWAALHNEGHSSAD